MPEPRRPDRPRALGAALVLAALAAGCGSTGTPAADRLVLRNFTLIDGTGRAPLADAAMVVEDGRVAWTGPAAELDVSLDTVRSHVRSIYAKLQVHTRSGASYRGSSELIKALITM